MTKFLRFIAYSFLVIVLLKAVLALLFWLNKPEPINNSWFSDKENGPLVIAHGGGLDLMPSNTMLAYDHAVKLGVDVLEMDVNLTKDGQLVCIHDKTIDRTSDGNGKVIDYSFRELLQFNFGANFKDTIGEKPYQFEQVNIPLLQEVFEKHRHNARFIVEIKNKDSLGIIAADELLRLVNFYRISDKVMIASFHDEVYDYINKIAPDQPVSAPKGQATAFVLNYLFRFNPFQSPFYQALHLPESNKVPVLGKIDLTDPRLMEFAHRFNLALHYWTVNDPEMMQQLIDNGADGIMTDRPDLLLSIIN